jgi:hypothetical protein
MDDKEEGITKDLLSEAEVSSLESVDDPDETKEDISEEQSLVDLTIGDNERSAEQDQDQDKEENYQGTLSSPINDYFLKESEDQNCEDGQRLRAETEEVITEKEGDYGSYCGKRKREDVPHLPRNVGQHEFLTTCATSASSSSSSTSPSLIHIVTTALPQLENELKEMNYTVAQLKRSAYAIKSPRSVRLIDETLFDGNTNGNEDIIKEVTIQQLTERNDQLEKQNLSLKQALITLAINRRTKEKGNTDQQNRKITAKKENKEKTESAEFILASEAVKIRKNLSPEWTSQNIFLRSKDNNCSGGLHLAKCSYCQKVFRVERLSMLTDHVTKCICIGPLIEKAYFNDLTKVASSLY